jgi:dolichol-phosphate mannosyltransferase
LNSSPLGQNLAREMRSADLHLAEADAQTELAVVVPTFNERENIAPLLERLNAALTGIRWEVIFVDDDSPDGTADALRQVAQRSRNVRVIRRIGRRGLSSACVEGVLSSSAPFFAVIDADMQHDEQLLPLMLKTLKDQQLDIVIGSRYVEGGSVRSWNERRRLISRLAGRASRLVVKADLKDPMSGFFLMRRQAFDETVRNLSQHGFKILLDLFASAPKPLRFAELPYHFKPRVFGESKLDSLAAWEYGMLLADKTFGRLIPPRLVFFGLIGGLGLLVHMSVLAGTLYAGLAFSIAQTLAVIVAMTSNFMLNNWITYRDRRLSGWAWLRGLLSFYAICSMGAVANVGIASFIFAGDHVWWVAGLTGALVGAVWNYALSALFTWRRR